MSRLIHIDEAKIQAQLREVVRNSTEGTLNAMLDPGTVRSERAECTAPNTLGSPAGKPSTNGQCPRKCAKNSGQYLRKGARASRPNPRVFPRLSLIAPILILST